MTRTTGNSLFWGPFSRLCAIVVGATFVLDQAHKAWMLQAYNIKERGRVSVLPFMDFVFVLNKGVSYGLLSFVGQGLLIALAVVTATALWIWVAKAGDSKLMAISFGLIIGGALANSVDRWFHGGVVDYVSLHAFGYYWYVFNIADLAIVAGVIGLLYDSFWTSRNDASNAS